MRTRIVAFVVLMAAAAGGAAAQDSVDAARELYAAAAYEEALAVLNRLHPADRPAVEARSIEHIPGVLSARARPRAGGGTRYRRGRDRRATLSAATVGRLASSAIDVH